MYCEIYIIYNRRYVIFIDNSNLWNINFLNFLISDLQVISNSISFIAEFSLKCPNQIDNMPLFAVLPNGRIAYVFRVGDKYQVIKSFPKIES